MAQRTIHYIFGEIFSKQIILKNKDRFLLGSVMPDAYADVFDRDKTHYTTKTENQIFFDFCAFRDQYHELILKDDLYLGYYMHLVEDAFYRQFIYNERFKIPRTREEVTILHNDYHILNSYIVNKYNIHNTLKTPIDLGQEPICKIATSIINEFIEDMSYDFKEQTIGETHFLTENMVDEFIDKYVPLGLDELQHIQNGKYTLQALDYTWAKER
ncbi:MAG: zinc dependent phospholipase C family protein [Lachnospiraceae bacterium]|nr:zinc dependent phospholipase C family protein [Lachnospiraceae bacterium]